MSQITLYPRISDRYALKRVALNKSLNTFTNELDGRTNSINIQIFGKCHNVLIIFNVRAQLGANSWQPFHYKEELCMVGFIRRIRPT